MGRPVVNPLRPTIGDEGAAQPFAPNSDQFFTLVVPMQLDDPWHDTQSLSNLMIPGTLEVCNYTALTVGIDFGVVASSILLTQLAPVSSAAQAAIRRFQAVCPPFSLGRFRWPELQRQLRRWSYTLDAVIPVLSWPDPSITPTPSVDQAPDGFVSFAVLEDVLETSISSFMGETDGTIASAMDTVQVTVQDSATEIATDNPIRTSVKITNPFGGNTVYLGPDSSVDSTVNGFVVPGDSVIFQGTEAVWGICTISNSQVVSVIEETV